MQSVYLRFWGKAGGHREGEPSWHPLAYHSLDVAAVADALLDANPRKLDAMAQMLGTSSDHARRFLVCLIALHDVGKFSQHFQAKAPQEWRDTVEKLFGAWAPPQSCRHDAVGYELRELLGLRALLQPTTAEWLASEFNAVWAAVAGHHGQPRNDNTQNDRYVVSEKSLAAADAFCRAVCKMFAPLEALPEPDEDALKTLSWLLCGLTVVADWIGSNRDWFAYRAPNQTLADYWDYARKAATDAIRKAGIEPSNLPHQITAERLFPDLADRLSPLQAHVRDMALPKGPSLTIIEDVTGSGKTEAAVLLAARLMAAGEAGGIFFALPTMATANAMYERLSTGYARLYADDARPSLVLGHGKRMLNDKFTDTILTATSSDKSYEEEGGATCAAWIADDRRKVFLAEIGIGTIDQALLGVLPSRHQVLRLWGLSDRVLIIDEAHAYDAYMAKEMERQLEFQAALGGSAIVLSATLPEKQRAALEAAFARGLGIKPTADATQAYPLLTQVSRSGQVLAPVASRADRSRRLMVSRIEAFDAAVDHVSAMADAGCAVAWIRNAVDDAIEAAAALRAHGHSPVLLHARFAMGDRLDIEQNVRTTLGRGDQTGNRRRFVIVGTQILEQSLDYDVDAMVTDLAPIDLVIQRAGRLWRHTDRVARPIDEAELCVLAPDPATVQSRDWYREMLPRAAAVYAHHGLVWRSARTLFAHGVIDTPAGVRGMIEEVYGVDGFDDVPEVLRKASQDAIGREGAARSFANANLLNVREGYGGNPALWTADTLTPTRLGDPVTVFRLGRIERGSIVPYYADDNLARAWALSEVSLSRKRATGVPASDAALAALINAAKTDWPEWEREMPLLVLEPDGDHWRGVVETGDKMAISLRYDKQSGLVLSSSSVI
ncbi:MAG: CRISPR-associated helicase Cas3' [Hyphomicrobiaceae bacterium]